MTEVPCSGPQDRCEEASLASRGPTGPNAMYPGQPAILDKKKSRVRLPKAIKGAHSRYSDARNATGTQNSTAFARIAAALRAAADVHKGAVIRGPSTGNLH